MFSIQTAAIILSIVIGFWLGHITDYLRNRSYDLEIQDHDPIQGNYTLEQYDDLMRALAELNTIDKGGYQATLKMFRKLEKEPESVLEIGFGRGDFSILLGTIYSNSSIVGIGAHNLSVNFANLNLANYTPPLSNVKFELCPVSEMPQNENSYDVITTTLVNHHIFPDEEFIQFLKYVRHVGKKAFIFNDLYRSVPSYLMSYFFLNLLRDGIGSYVCSFLSIIHLILPLEIISTAVKFGQMISNRPSTNLIIDSGLKSIEKSFTVMELKEMFKLAGYPEDAMKCDYYYIPGRVVCSVDLES